MALPVVVVTTNGLPVTVVTNGYGLPVEVAANGIGTPVIVVPSGGLPVIGLSVGPDVTAPVITSSNTVSWPENSILNHVLTANEAVTWAKVGGADTAKFTLVGNTLTLPAKDFENPDDAGLNNTYIVQVQATDTASNVSLVQTITVTITDVFEVGPTAPILAMDPAWVTTDATPDFTVDIDDTIGAGDDLRLQIQVAGGDWSSPVDDVTHTITALEDAANEIALGSGSLSNASYEARARVDDGTVSAWSNVVSFTVAAVATGHGLMWGTDAIMWGADYQTWEMPVPAISVAPVISGNTQVGQTLTTTDGTWTETPTSYAYQWKNAGTNISGATASTYVLALADAGAVITCAVTASNATGAGAPATSNSLTIDVYLTFVTTVVDPTDTATYSGGVWNGVALGTAAPNRKIVAAFAARTSTTPGAFSSSTLDGVSMTHGTSFTAATAQNKIDIKVINKPTGTTGNLILTYTTAQERAGVGIWALYGAKSNIPYFTGSAVPVGGGGTIASIPSVIPAKGAGIAATVASGTPTLTWTNMTERFDTTIEASVPFSGADIMSNTGSTTLTNATWSAAPATAAPAASASWGVPHAAVTYQGPGDIVSGAVAWYSPARAYSAAFAATAGPIMDLVDAATGTIPTTINILPTGFVDIAAIPTTPQKVTKLYDQTGNGKSRHYGNAGNDACSFVCSIEWLAGFVYRRLYY